MFRDGEPSQPLRPHRTGPASRARVSNARATRYQFGVIGNRHIDGSVGRFAADAKVPRLGDFIQPKCPLSRRAYNRQPSAYHRLSVYVMKRALLCVCFWSRTII